MTQRHTIAIVLLAIAAVVAIPLIATHQAHACFGRRDLDCNPTTGNPHPTAGFGDQNPGTTETGNPHNSQSCTGKPQGEVGFDTCPGTAGTLK